jgi:opacity protein-like surface antigen
MSAGAGIDYALTNHILLRGEYLFYYLGKISTSIDMGYGGTGTMSSTLKGNLLKGQIAYKF